MRLKSFKFYQKVKIYEISLFHKDLSLYLNKSPVALSMVTFANDVNVPSLDGVEEELLGLNRSL